jgi:glucose/arabinose dehydrogenase
VNKRSRLASVLMLGAALLVLSACIPETPTAAPAGTPTLIISLPEETQTPILTETPTDTPTLAPSPTVGGPVNTVGLELVADGLISPVDLVPAGDGRLLVVDQPGLIYSITPEGGLASEPFLDIQDRVPELSEGYDERGLLGLALHPDFAENRRFYVYYTALKPETGVALDETYTFVNRLSEWQVADDGQADPASERVLLEIPEPQTNHNGGDIGFGPDGYLYVPLGDGGGGNDAGPGHVDDWYTDYAGGNGQDVTHNLLGSILRIDVDGGDPYGIPADNPTLGDAAGPTEQWAFGLRNPWRATWDRETGDYYVADAGQSLWEEVSIVEAGGNYGWNVLEGTHCFNSGNAEQPPESCPDTDAWGDPLRLPVIEFPNGSGTEDVEGLVVVGGYVYRGSAIPGLVGEYVFGQWSRDFGQPLGSLIAAERGDDGELWPLRELAIAGREGGALGEYVLSFGQDADGELYVLTSGTPGPSGESGRVYRIVLAGPGEG